MSFADLPMVSIHDKGALTEGEYLFFVDFKEPVLKHTGFYVFLSVVKGSDELDVFFQSADPLHESFHEQEYNAGKVTFEGIGQARTRKRNVMAISDFGHYIPGITSSYYCGSATINYCDKIGAAIELIMNRMDIDYSNVVFIGSSAGADGALHTATYMRRPVTVIAVNPWIVLHNIMQLREYYLNAFGDLSEDELLKRYGPQLNASTRYREATTLPVLRLLLNRNDKQCFHRGMSFVNSCGRRFRRLMVDIYEGPNQHARPPKDVFLRRIEEARMLGHEELIKQGAVCRYEEKKGKDLFEHLERILLPEKVERADILRDAGILAMDCKKLDSAERLFRAALKERPHGDWIKQLLKETLTLKNEARAN